MCVLIRRWAVGILLAALGVAAGGAEREQGARLSSSDSYVRQAEKVRWLAEQGGAQAQYRLAELYERGLGVPQNFGQAIDWYRKAALQGYEPARIKLRTLGAPVHDQAPAEKEREDVIEEAGGVPENITIQIRGTVFAPSTLDFDSPGIIFVPSSPRQRLIPPRRPFVTSQNEGSHDFKFSTRLFDPARRGARSVSRPVSGD